VEETRHTPARVVDVFIDDTPMTGANGTLEDLHPGSHRTATLVFHDGRGGTAHASKAIVVS
jgi:hypothetical protein